MEEEYNNKKRQINLKKALAFIFVLCIIIFVESIDFIENLIRKQPKIASHSSHSFQPTLQDYTSARPKHRKSEMNAEIVQRNDTMDIFTQVVIMLAGAIGINMVFRKYVKPLTNWAYWFVGMFAFTFVTNIISLYLVSIGTIPQDWGPVIIQTIAIGILLLFMPREPGKFGRKMDPSEKDDDNDVNLKKRNKPKI